MSEGKFTYSDSEITELVLSTYSRLMMYVKNALRCTKEKAEDILQESILKFLKKRADLDRSKVESYLFMIVKNESRNYATRCHEGVKLSDNAWDVLASVDFSEDDQDTNETFDIDTILKFSGTFPQRTREIFQQSRIEGKTHSEIAETLGITERSVENHLKNSVERFRKEFRS